MNLQNDSCIFKHQKLFKYLISEDVSVQKKNYFVKKRKPGGIFFKNNIKELV